MLQDLLLNSDSFFWLKCPFPILLFILLLVITLNAIGTFYYSHVTYFGFRSFILSKYSLSTPYSFFSRCLYSSLSAIPYSKKSSLTSLIKSNPYYMLWFQVPFFHCIYHCNKYFYFSDFLNVWIFHWNIKSLKKTICLLWLTRLAIQDDFVN